MRNHKMLPLRFNNSIPENSRRVTYSTIQQLYPDSRTTNYAKVSFMRFFHKTPFMIFFLGPRVFSYREMLIQLLILIVYQHTVKLYLLKLLIWMAMLSYLGQVSNQERLLRYYTYSLYIWSIWYGPYNMDNMIWTIWYGPYDMDHII